MQGIKDELPREVASAISEISEHLLLFPLGATDDAQDVHRSMNS